MKKAISIFLLFIILCLYFSSCTLYQDQWEEIEPAPNVNDTISIAPWNPQPSVPQTPEIGK